MDCYHLHFYYPNFWDHLSVLLEPASPMYFPKSGDGMMLPQFFGSESNEFSLLGFAHSLHPLQLKSSCSNHDTQLNLKKISELSYLCTSFFYI
jgi:hypothetical protein